MTKLQLAIIFIISDMFCFGAYLVCQNSKSRFQKAIANVTGWGFFTTTAYTLTLILNTYESMCMAYGIYFFSMDWLCAALAFYLVTYSYNLNPRIIKKAAYVICPILAIDSLSQIVNIWTSHSIRYILHYRVNGDLLFTLMPDWPFQIHLIICYALLLIGVVSLIVRTITSSKIYRTKYLSIMGVLFLLVFINAIFVYGNFEIDFSIIGYSIGAILLALYTLKIMPGQLAEHMSGSLVEHLNSSVTLFDDFGYIVLENNLSLQYRSDKTQTLSQILDFLHIHLDDYEKEYRNDTTVSNEGGTVVLDVRFQNMYEETITGKKKRIGSFLIIDNVTKQREELREREYYATHDELTGFYNQQYFLQQAQELVNNNPDEKFAIAMTNISQFKLFNEVFGKTAGDQLLQDMANNFHRAATGRDFVYGRYESDRFVSCIPMKYCTEEFIKKHRIDEPVQRDTFKVVNYIGICEMPEKNMPITKLCERAAIALTTIKGDAKRHFAYYDSTMTDYLLRERELVAAFPKALENDEIQIYIQPQVDQLNGRLIGGEVLARWMTEEGIISPVEFVPILEKNGLITELNMRVWEKACKQLAKFHQNEIKISLSVNISTQDFYRIDLYDTFTKLVKKYEIDAQYVKLEITESNFLTNIDEQLILIHRLQEAGFVIEMDDFGSGYSSLNSLKDIPVDVIKMDLKFLENVKNKERGEVIIRNIIRMASELEVKVIAEGVERQEQADMLKDMGCCYIQGFLFGRPMPIEVFKEFCDKLA